jgi:hypothetical protein
VAAADVAVATVSPSRWLWLAVWMSRRERIGRCADSTEKPLTGRLLFEIQQELLVQHCLVGTLRVSSRPGPPTGPSRRRGRTPNPASRAAGAPRALASPAGLRVIATAMETGPSGFTRVPVVRHGRPRAAY